MNQIPKLSQTVTDDLASPAESSVARSMAALSAIEALMIVLVETRMIDKEKLIDALEDAISRHRQAAGNGDRNADHRRAMNLLEQLISDCAAVNHIDPPQETE